MTTDPTAAIQATATLIAAIGALITAIGAVWIGLVNASKQDANHKLMNSRLSELLATTGREEHAKGVIQGADQANAAADAKT